MRRRQRLRLNSPRFTRARSAFEINIEIMILQILNRHMANAREEITRSMLAEFRAQPHGGKHDKQAK
jgi:hypothetical protein